MKWAWNLMRLHCENDDEDVDEDDNINGHEPKKSSVWIGVFQKATQRPSRTGATLLSTVTSVYLFFTHSSFPCTIISCTLSTKSKTVPSRF